VIILPSAHGFLGSGIIPILPPNFILNDLVNQPPAAWCLTPLQSTGTNSSGTIHVSGGSAPSIVPSPNVAPFASFYVRDLAPSSWGSTGNLITVELNGYSQSYRITTPPLPASMWGSALTQTVGISTGYHVNTIKFSNILGLYSMTAVGAVPRGVSPTLPNPMMSRDGINWASSLILTPADNNNWIAVEIQAPKYSTAFGETSASFSISYGALSVVLGTFTLVGS
jgi:hypothetical protein